MNLTDFYQQVGGSYEVAIARLRKDTLISKYLKMFLADDSYAKLAEAYEAKDSRKIFEASHALKGLAANLELTNLFNAASTICEDTRHGEPTGDIDKEFEAVHTEYDNAVSAINEVD